MSGSEGGEIPDRGAEGNYPTTGARCGAVQQNLGAKGEGEDEKISPSEIFLQQLKISSRTSKFLPDWAEIGYQEEETREPLVVTCSKEQGRQGEASKSAVFKEGIWARGGGVENGAKTIEVDLLRADVVSCSGHILEGSGDDPGREGEDIEGKGFRKITKWMGPKKYYGVKVAAAGLSSIEPSDISHSETEESSSGEEAPLHGRLPGKPSYRGAEGTSASSRLARLEENVEILGVDLNEHLWDFEDAVKDQNVKDGNMVMGVQLLAEGLGKQIGKVIKLGATVGELAARQDADRRARFKLEREVNQLRGTVQRLSCGIRGGTRGAPMGPRSRGSDMQGFNRGRQSEGIICFFCREHGHKSCTCPKRRDSGAGPRGRGSRGPGANNVN